MTIYSPDTPQMMSAIGVVESLLIMYARLIFRFSAPNASRVFASSMADDTISSPPGWNLSSRLTTDQVWDAIIILSLLEDAVRQGRLLAAPHMGD